MDGDVMGLDALPPICHITPAMTKSIPSYPLPELTPAERQFWHSCVDMLGTATIAGNRREPQAGRRG